MTENLNSMYERMMRGGTTRPAREFPSNMGDVVRATTNTPTFNPVSYAGDLSWADHSQETSPADNACNPTPVEIPVLGEGRSLRANPDYYTRGQVYTDTIPAPITPYPVGVAGSFAGEVCQPGDRFATEEARLNEFRRAVREARNEDRDSGPNGREYVRGLTNGELVNAAKAYEYLRPELWPFNGSRRFDAPERSEWERMARAVAFLKLEQWRIDAGYGTPEYEEAYRDLEQEIRRLEFKAIDQRWPKRSVQDTEIDPF